jgi:hypothetical protein
MEDRTTPPPTPCILVRVCEASRLQRQLLTRAYQQVCPEIRSSLREVPSQMPSREDRRGSSSAARVAAGA